MPTETDESSVRVILESLRLGGQLQMDFKEVAKEFGIARADNAGTKFQNQLKRWGYKWDRTSGKLFLLESAPVTPKKATTKATTASGPEGSTGKKRKLNNTQAGGDVNGTENGDIKTGDGGK